MNSPLLALNCTTAVLLGAASGACLGSLGSLFKHLNKQPEAVRTNGSAVEFQ